MSFSIYLLGYAFVIAGLAYGATLAHIPNHWIAVMVIVLIGVGILSGVANPPDEGSFLAPLAEGSPLHNCVQYIGCMLRLFSLASLLVVAAFAQAHERLYVVTHVDLMGPFIVDGGKLLSDHAAESRRDPGSVRYEIVIEPARKNHLTIVSVWESRDAFEKHSALPHTVKFREKLQPMLGGPLDERLHVLLP